MRNGAWFIAIAFVLLTGPFAFADDKSECLDGIKAINGRGGQKFTQASFGEVKAGACQR
jgi:hypothetical protein